MFTNKQLTGLIVFAFILLLAVFWNTAHAAEIHIRWDANPEPDIQCYRVYMGTQVDLSTWAWEQVAEINAPTTELVYDVPTDALRLFRVSACDTAGQESIRYNAGVFSCFQWMPPGEPAGTGIE